MLSPLTWHSARAAYSLLTAPAPALERSAGNQKARCHLLSEAPTIASSLAALAVRLEAYGLVAELTPYGVRVINPKVSGCCKEVPHPCDLIKCHSRQGHDGPWFWTSWREPLAPAHRPDDALIRIRAYLTRAEHKRHQADGEA